MPATLWLFAATEAALDATVDSLENAKPASNHECPQLQENQPARFDELNRVQHNIFQEKVKQTPNRALHLTPNAPVQGTSGSLGGQFNGI